MTNTYNVTELIQNQLYENAINELSGVNKTIFLNCLHRYLDNPKSKTLEATFKENLSTAIKSILLLRRQNKIPSSKQLLDLNEVLRGLGGFLDRRGYEGELETKIRRTYLLLHNCLKNLPKTVEHSARPTIGYGQERDEHLCIVQYERWNPAKNMCVPIQQKFLNDRNYQYAKFYYKVLDENAARIKRDLSVFSKSSYPELSEAEQLAYDDAIKTIQTGISYFGSRGDLNDLDRPRCEITNRKLLSGANHLMDRISEERVKKIQFLEDFTTTELRQDNWLHKAILKRIKERR